MIQFTTKIDKHEATIIMSDGGVAIINFEDPSHIFTMYYQERIERLAQSHVPNPLTISDDEWDELAEGKSYQKDWDDISKVLTMEMIKDAVDWLMLGTGDSFPALTESEKSQGRAETLGAALPKEIARCQELLGQYKSLGQVGAFGHAMISAVIADAHKAMIEGDVVKMISSYEKLKSCE